MAANQDGQMIQFGTRVPPHVEAAFADFTNEVNYQNPLDNITPSHIQRQALYEFLLNHWDELPDESKDNLEKDWLKDKTEGGLGVDL